MDDFKKLIKSLAPIGVEIMKRAMAVAILRELLGRDPTGGEVLTYENEVWLRDLNQWWQDRHNSYRKIHDLVWGGN
jgi:hypothetical protein